MKKKLNLWIHGISGKVGSHLRDQLQHHHHFILSGGSDFKTQDSILEEGLGKSDAIIDFTSKEGNEKLFQTLEKLQYKNITLVIGSTGISPNQRENWKSYAQQLESRILFAPNTSLGVLMMLKSALLASELGRSAKFDIEIEESHHKHKKDSPSGTSLFLAESLNSAIPESSIAYNRTSSRKDGEIGISATRGGGIFGEHKIRFLGDFEEFTLTHRAYSRELYAKGALSLTEWLLKQESGFYTLNDIS